MVHRSLGSHVCRACRVGRGVCFVWLFLLGRCLLSFWCRWRDPSDSVNPWSVSRNVKLEEFHQRCHTFRWSLDSSFLVSNVESQGSFAGCLKPSRPNSKPSCPKKGSFFHILYIYIYIVVMFQVYACLSYRGLKISTDGDRSSGRWDPGLVARLLMRIITEGSTAVMCLGTVGLTGGTSFFWGGPRVFVDP